MLSKHAQRQDEGPCDRTSHASQGLHVQYCCEESFHHVAQPTARCTECSRPRHYREMLPCNSVPGQSRGPHLQCTEKPVHHCAVPLAQHRDDRDRCTECCRPRHYRETLLCNSVPGQSRGPHVQCTENTVHHCTLPLAQHQDDRGRCTECRRPQNYGPERPLCNSIPRQSRGPHLQCTEE